MRQTGKDRERRAKEKSKRNIKTQWHTQKSHENTKLKTVMCKQKIYKVKNAQSIIYYETKNNPWKYHWVPFLLAVYCWVWGLPWCVVCVSSEILLEKIIFFLCHLAIASGSEMGPLSTGPSSNLELGRSCSSCQCLSSCVHQFCFIPNTFSLVVIPWALTIFLFPWPLKGGIWWGHPM